MLRPAVDGQGPRRSGRLLGLRGLALVAVRLMLVATRCLWVAVRGRKEFPGNERSAP